MARLHASQPLLARPLHVWARPWHASVPCNLVERPICQVQACADSWAPPPRTWLQGASFYWLFRTHQNILTYTPCLGNPDVELALAPGWGVAAWGNLSQAVGPALPLLWVLENNETAQMVFMVRSTLSNFEWALDFRFNEVGGFDEVGGR